MTSAADERPESTAGRQDGDGDAARSERGDARDGRHTIGRVVEQLQAEFPDLSISKVRYLEDRGLLTPERTHGGYRTFSAADVRRLRTILVLQRDEFLPLEVIKQRLDRGTASALSRPLVPDGSLEGAAVLHREEERRSWADVMSETGVDEEFLGELAEYRLIEASPRSLDGTVGQSDVEVVQICAVLARFGVEPRNLRLLRSSAEREAALLEQAVTPLLRSTHEERRLEGERNLQELGSLTSRLIDLLLYKELRRLVE